MTAVIALLLAGIAVAAVFWLIAALYSLLDLLTR